MKCKKGIGLITVILIIAVIVVLVIVGAILINSNSNKIDTNTPNASNNTSKSLNTNENTNNTIKKELIYNSTEAFDYSEVEGGIIITYFKNYDYTEYDKIIIPVSIDGKTVIGIGSLNKQDIYYGRVFGAVFGKCEVVIPETVKYIGGNAFSGAKGLVKLSGGANCKTIGEYAFMNCENLSEVTFINSITDLADNAFAGCTTWNTNH